MPCLLLQSYLPTHLTTHPALLMSNIPCFLLSPYLGTCSLSLLTHSLPSIGNKKWEFLTQIFPVLPFLYVLCAQLLQLCPTPCDPMDCSPPDSSVHGILQTRILEWAAMPSSRGSSDPGIKPHSHVSCIGRRVLYHECHLGTPTAST